MMSPHQKKKITVARLGCWNVRSMKNDQKEAESMMKMKAILAECGAVEVSTTGRREGQDLDVAGLVETNMDATGEEDVEDWKIYHSGSKQREGVSLAVRRRVAHLVTTWRPVSGRLVYVDMKVAKGKPWRIIAAYAPTATKEHQKETEKFYRDLTRTVAGVSRWTVLGDMNARLPMGATDITGRHGRSSNQRPNLNTPALAAFLRENAAHSSASYFQHGHHHYATWRNPGTGKRFGTIGWQQIDHVCYSNSMRGCVQDTKVAQEAWATFPGQDHQLLVSQVRVDAFGWYGKKRKRGTARKCHELPRPAAADPEKKEKYNERVTKLTESGKTLQEAVTRAANEVWGEEKQEKPWISAEFRELWAERRQAITDGEEQKARKILKAMKRMERRDQARFVDEICREAEDHFERRGHAPAIRVVAKLGGKKAAKKTRNIQPPLTHEKETAYSAEGRAEMHRRFFAEVFGGGEPESYPDPPTEEPGRRTAAGANADVEVTDKEIAAAIDRLGGGKAAGTDGMVKEHVMLMNEQNKKKVFDAVREYWRKGKMSAAEVRSLITVLPKPGKDHRQTDGWRPISLLNFLAKVYASLLYMRLAGPINAVLSEEQNGFRPYRRATDNTATLKNLTQQRHREGKTTHACFIDLRQCFDRVPRGLIARALQYYEIPAALQERFWALYEGHSFCVKREGRRSAETKTRTGTKQGCLLSPLIYNLVANFVFEHLPGQRSNGEAAGVGFESSGLLEGEAALRHVLRDLQFADDTVLLEETQEGLEELTRKACDLLKAFGLEVNYKKTKFMIFGGQDEQTQTIVTAGGRIARVFEFEYLGTILTEDCHEARDIENRITLAQKKYGELSGIFNNPRTPAKLKIKILKAFVLPVAVWGCESWSLVASERATLDTWWNKKLRHCLGVTKWDHIRTEEILQRTGQIPLPRLVEERRLRYYGHVVRYPQDRWVRKILGISGNGAARGRGALKTWRTQVEHDLQRRGGERKDAEERGKWREVVKREPQEVQARPRAAMPLTIQQHQRNIGRRREI
mmetsp:Transcript_24955/g.62763  ORF Transcript_24955/g.62763 Transcript_24955/m.62763 type:complete len:1031 (+) Transcript_24955:305-3397(+)